MLLRYFRYLLWAVASLPVHAQTFGLIAVDPVNRNLLWGASLAGTPERSVLYRSLDQSKVWQGVAYNTDRANTSRIYDVKTHPDLPNRVYVLTTDAGGYLWTSTDAGATWKHPSLDWTVGLRPVVVRVAPSPSQLVYVQIGRQLRRSTDGGTTFGPAITIPCSDDVGIEMSLSNPRRLGCDSNGIFSYSTDAGDSWLRGATVPAITATCTLLNHRTLENSYYVYCFTTQSEGQRDLYFRSVDGLQTLTPLTLGPSLGGIAASPDRSLILVSRLSSTFRSRDLGTTWEPTVNLSLGFSALGFDPLDSNILYYRGESRSIDAGTSFTQLNSRFLPVPAFVISTGGVVTLGGRAKVAPGAIFSIYGSELADGTADSPVPPLKTKLGSTSVQVNGVDIPLFFVSPLQINAQMPYNIPVGTAKVRAIRNGSATSEESVQIAAAAPDVIQYGAGRAVAVNQDGRVNGLATPAAKGSYVVLYLTGIGAVSPALTAGLAAPGVEPFSQATLPNKITLTNGATVADVAPLFLGHTPGYAGLVQANFQIPDLPAADYTLVLTVGGETSNAVKLAVGP